MVLLAKKLSHGAKLACGFLVAARERELPQGLEVAVDMMWMRSLRASTSVGAEKTGIRHVGQVYSGDKFSTWRFNISRMTGKDLPESWGYRDTCCKSFIYSLPLASF